MRRLYNVVWGLNLTVSIPTYLDGTDLGSACVCAYVRTCVRSGRGACIHMYVSLYVHLRTNVITNRFWMISQQVHTLFIPDG